METVVKKFGNSIGVSIPAQFRTSKHIDIGSIVEVTEHGSDVLILVKGKSVKSPTLKEMIAACDLSAPFPAELVEFDEAPSVGNEAF